MIVQGILFQIGFTLFILLAVCATAWIAWYLSPPNIRDHITMRLGLWLIGNRETPREQFHRRQANQLRDERNDCQKVAHEKGSLIKAVTAERDQYQKLSQELHFKHQQIVSDNDNLRQMAENALTEKRIIVDRNMELLEKLRDAGKKNAALAKRCELLLSKSIKSTNRKTAARKRKAAKK